MFRVASSTFFVVAALVAHADAQLSGGASGPLGNLNFNFGQSSSQSIVSTTPSLTTLDGYPGSFSSGIIRPFVIGVTPVVGDYPIVVDHGAEARQQQLSTLYQSQVESNNKRLVEFLRRAERAEADGNARMARANYRRAVGLASGSLRQQILARLKK